jgi:hypothetical protein
MLRSLFASCVFAICALASAQAPNMSIPAEVKKLDWLLGEWSGTIKWVMPGMEGSGPMNLKNNWEGQFLKCSTVTEAEGMKMTEESYFGWNAEKKQYDCWTFTNFAPTPRRDSGHLTGDRLVMTSEPWEISGEKIEGRGTMTKNSPTELGFLLEFKMEGKWVKAAEGILKKK